MNLKLAFGANDREDYSLALFQAIKKPPGGGAPQGSAVRNHKCGGYAFPSR